MADFIYWNLAPASGYSGIVKTIMQVWIVDGDGNLIHGNFVAMEMTNNASTKNGDKQMEQNQYGM